MSGLTVASQGRAKVSIFADGSETAVQTAAHELAHYLGRMTGARFDVAPEGDGAGIHLAVKDELAEEAFRIRCSSGGLTIDGGSGRGVLYGVYALLEDVLGVRFYTHDVTYVPRYEELAVDEMDMTQAPAFEYRDLSTVCATPQWRACNRIHDRADPMTAFGGSRNYALFVHTFNQLVDREIYFDEHPEYFSMVKGVRVKERSQLCLTHPEVIAIATENARKHLRQHPGASIISISQNDCYNPCECPECARIDAENGSHAGSLVYFVNAVAEGIEAEFPHVIVDTLAYQYTRTPPMVIRPRHNVCVRLCSIECCFGHPMAECDHVASFAKVGKTSAGSFQEDLIGWSRICDRIYIWDYVTNFAHYWLPFPNFHVIGPNMRFFAANGVKGVFEQGNGMSVNPDLEELRSWLLAKLLWNPEFDVERGIYEFTEAVYGPAAGEIRAYIYLMQERVKQGNIHFGIYEFPFVGYLDPETLAQAEALLRTAAARELTLRQRLYVERAALTVEYAMVAQQTLSGQADTARMEAMFEKARALGISRISEWIDWYPFVRLFREWNPQRGVQGNLLGIAAFADLSPLADLDNVISL